MLAETPPVVKRNTSKPKHTPAQYIQRSNERNALIQKIQARNEQLLMKESEQLDEIYMFLRGLALTTKKFPSKGRIEAKKKIFTLMTELEEKYLVAEQPIYHEQLIYPLQTTQQPLIHIPSENTYNIQPLSSFEASPSTSAYSESTSSQFSLYNIDDSSA